MLLWNSVCLQRFLSYGWIVLDIVTTSMMGYYVSLLFLCVIVHRETTGVAKANKPVICTAYFNVLLDVNVIHLFTC